MDDLGGMGGDDHLDVPDPAYVEEVVPELLLPSDMERDLRLVDDDDGALGRMEEEGVEHDEDLLLARRQGLEAEGGSVVHPDSDLARLGDLQGLVDEDLVDDVLEDDYGLGEEVVPLDVVRYGAGHGLASRTVLDDVVPGGRELGSGRYIGFETRIPDEIQLGLEVLAPELQLAVAHLAGLLGRVDLQFPVLLGVPDGLEQLLRIDLQSGGQMAVAPLEGEPLGRDVDHVADLSHLRRRQRGLDLAPLHLDEEVPGIVLYYEIRTFVESDVHALEACLAEILDIAAERGIDHPHQGALAHPVGGVDEREGFAQLQLVIVFVEKSGDVHGVDLHGRTLIAFIRIKPGFRPSSI